MEQYKNNRPCKELEHHINQESVTYHDGTPTITHQPRPRHRCRDMLETASEKAFRQRRRGPALPRNRILNFK